MAFKQIDEIDLNDIEESPVWMFLSEDDPLASDELTVKAISPESIDHSSSIYIAKTKFILANGEVFTGYCTPDCSGKLEDCQPVVFCKNTSIGFWYGIKPVENLKESYDIFGVQKEHVFPIAWECEFGYITKKSAPGFPTYGQTVFLGVQPIEGEISGFGFIESGEVRYVA
ncbi:MAG: hypothetical protein VB954_06555 [Thalassolituus sp.]|uniref:hypothetical protein n=1 Tax=Thalassolituus sp. TaxID=2030822 RepID=UPI0039827E55